MSAVMSTLSMISGGGRARRKLNSARKSGQLSDAGEERARSQHDLRQQRSASLQTLETGGGGVGHLDSLEAKMASIEVSLAGRRRSAAGREGARELDALRAALTDKDVLIQNLKKQLSASLSASRLSASPGCMSPTDAPTPLSADERRALDERAANVRAELDHRRDNIQELRRRLDKTHVTENIDSRIQQAELQYQLGREELEMLSLGEQARALALLAEHADAAARRHATPTVYSMVRECGGTATLVTAEVREGTWGCAVRAAGALVEWPGDNTVLRQGDRLVEVNGSMVVSCRSTEQLQRVVAAASPARVVLLRATNQHPSSLPQNEASAVRCELSSLRAAAQEAERAKEGLRNDNTRLTHRISYLEDQVAELLARHPQLQSASSTDSSCITVNKSKRNVTNINISSEPKGSPKSEVQVFQKGPDITAIVAKLPGLEGDSNLPVMRPRSNASGASSRAAVSPRASPAPRPHSLEPRPRRDYTSQADAAIRMIERNQRHLDRQRRTRSRPDDIFDSDADNTESRHSVCDPRHYEIRKAADRIEESIKKTNWAERKTLSIIEQLKRSQKLRKQKKNESAEDIQADSEKHHSMYNRIDGKVLENAHKSSRRSSKVHSRSAKSSEMESESDFPNGEMYGSSPRIDYCSDATTCHYRRNDERREGDGKARPTPPRKPLRLSLHKARSAHSLLNGSESETPSRPQSEMQRNGDESVSKRPVKRTHASERWVTRDSGESRGDARGTPRPARRLLPALSACTPAPHADRLYPDSHAPTKHSSKWC